MTAIFNLFQQNDGLDDLRFLAIAISIVTALIYLLVRPEDGYRGRTLVKSGLCAGLAALIFMHPVDQSAEITKNLAVLALLLCMGGDIFLSLGRDKLFLAGLVSFLLGHIFYIVLFAIWASETPIGGLEIAIMAVIVAASIVPLKNLWPHIERLKAPILAYFVVILSMGLMASLLRTQAPLIMIGALVFMLSDNILVFDKFKQPIKGGGYMVWTTYTIAQLLITADILLRLST